MAYVLKRSSRIVEEIQVGDDIIKVNLDVDSLAREFAKRQNDVIAAERELRSLDLEDLAKAQEVYGRAVIEMFRLIFGEDGADKILAFYENNYIEMCVEVFPFIVSVITPQMTKTLQEQRKGLAARYKGKK